MEKLILDSKSAGVGRPHYSGSAEVKKVFGYFLLFGTLDNELYCFMQFQ